MIHYSSPNPKEKWEGHMIELWNTKWGDRSRTIILSDEYSYDLDVSISSMNPNRDIIAVRNLDIICRIVDGKLQPLPGSAPLPEVLSSVLLTTMTVMDAILCQCPDPLDTETNFAASDEVFDFNKLVIPWSERAESIEYAE